MRRPKQLLTTTDIFNSEMEATKESNVILLSSLSEIKHPVGESDAYTMLKTVECTKKVNLGSRDTRSPLQSNSSETSPSYLVKGTSVRRSTSRMGLLRQPSSSEQRSPSTNNPVHSDIKSASDIVRSKVPSEVSEKDCAQKRVDIANIADTHQSASHPMNDKSVIESNMLLTTSPSYQPRSYVMSSNRFSVSYSADKTADRAEKSPNRSSILNRSRRSSVVHTSSSPLKQLFGSPTPVKDLHTFLYEFPENSPVRTVIRSSILSDGSTAHPSNRSSVTTSESGDRAGSEVGEESNQVGGKRNPNNDSGKDSLRSISEDSFVSENNFIEFVCLGADQSSFSKGNAALDILSEKLHDPYENILLLEKTKIKILDYYNMNQNKSTDTHDNNNDHGNGKHSCIIETISDYCFPSGLLIDVIPKSDVEKFTSSDCDSFHIMQFSNLAGVPTYASCIVITEQIPILSNTDMKNTNTDMIRTLLYQKRLFVKSANIIQKVFKQFLARRNRFLSKLSKDVPDSILERKLTFYNMSTPFKFRGKSSCDADDIETKIPNLGFGSVMMSRIKQTIGYTGAGTTGAEKEKSFRDSLVANYAEVDTPISVKSLKTEIPFVSNKLNVGFDKEENENGMFDDDDEEDEDDEDDDDDDDEEVEMEKKNKDRRSSSKSFSKKSGDIEKKSLLGSKKKSGSCKSITSCESTPSPYNNGSQNKAYNHNNNNDDMNHNDDESDGIYEGNVLRKINLFDRTPSPNRNDSRDFYDINSPYVPEMLNKKEYSHRDLNLKKVPQGNVVEMMKFINRSGGESSRGKVTRDSDGGKEEGADVGVMRKVKGLERNQSPGPKHIYAQGLRESDSKEQKQENRPNSSAIDPGDRNVTAMTRTQEIIQNLNNGISRSSSCISSRGNSPPRTVDNENRSINRCSSIGSIVSVKAIPIVRPVSTPLASKNSTNNDSACISSPDMQQNHMDAKAKEVEKQEKLKVEKEKELNRQYTASVRKNKIIKDWLSVFGDEKDYVLVTKKAYCTLSLQPLHSFSFSVRTQKTWRVHSLSLFLFILSLHLNFQNTYRYLLGKSQSFDQ